jgi:uncharacterized protein YdhG (YjbR/CyaY superfamily)
MVPTAMKATSKQPQTIDAYIASYPKDVQVLLKKIRSTIKKAAPKAQDKISYRIPTFFQDGNLIFFAAFKNHISVYPAPRGAAEFKQELSVYKGGKGTVQFPLGKPIPYGLITRIVKFRLKENLARATAKKKKRK